jgi:hypothetical protein
MVSSAKAGTARWLGAEDEVASLRAPDPAAAVAAAAAAAPGVAAPGGVVL